MSYQILSLKWRPLSFDQIIGQSHITQTLLNAISMNRLAQAFLFSGPRGVGKTTTARVLASTINKIDNYSNCLDIIEMDGASNRGIDEIREIRESVKFPPTSVQYKVYIIDEAHMLTDQAFNALLKTLEEPPPNVIFILATTDPQKMPQTILSRTQRYDFSRISVDSINERLQFILNEENIEFSDEALQLIAQKADGSMRDALSILDQVIAFSEKSISIDSISKAIGIISDDDMYELFYEIINNNIDKSIMLFHEILNSGISPSVFLDNFCSFLNNCMLIKINKNNSNIFLSKKIKSQILAQNSTTYLDCLRMLNITLNLSSRIKTISNPRISIEVLIAKLISMNPQISPKDTLVNNNQKSSSDNREAMSEKESNNPVKEDVSSDDKNNNQVDEDKTEEYKSEAFSQVKETKKINLDINTITSKWDQVLTKLDKKNSKISSFVEESTPLKIDNNKLILSVDGGNSFIKKVLEADKEIIIDVIKNVCEAIVDIEVVLTKLDKKEDSNQTKKEGDEKEHPLLEDAIKIFNGKVIS